MRMDRPCAQAQGVQFRETCADSPLARTSSITRFTLSDFDELGVRAGFRYDLPGYVGPTSSVEHLCIAEGRVQEYSIRPGVKLVLSDIVSHHQYVAAAASTPQFSAIVMLQGRALAQLDANEATRLVAQGGVSIACRDAIALAALHPAGQRLRSLNISFNPADAAADTPLADAVSKVMSARGGRLQRWGVPAHLLQSIEPLMQSAWQGTMHSLLLEGVSLQVLAHALAGCAQAPARATRISARDRQRLEQVRERLHSAPGADYTLAELAELACMSPSTLRVKFQAVYRRSVFGWLRERRLEVARDYLSQGWSVQQAAHFVGYRHATNFATAFRQRYGIAPSESN